MNETKKIKYCDYIVVNEKFKYFKKINSYNW